MTSWTKALTSKLLFKKMFISKRPGRAIFADIIKIVTMFNKTILKDSKTVIIVRKYIKMQSWINANISRIHSDLSRDSYIFESFLEKFHHCRNMSVKEVGLPPIRKQPGKDPSWIGLTWIYMALENYS